MVVSLGWRCGELSLEVRVDFKLGVAVRAVRGRSGSGPVLAEGTIVLISFLNTLWLEICHFWIL